jgi:hypothetical protein
MEIAAIFNESQRSASCHRKCCIEMKRLQDDIIKGRSEEERLQLEQAFIFGFIRNMNHVLGAKKTEDWAEGVMRFIQAYFEYSFEKGKL